MTLHLAGHRPIRYVALAASVLFLACAAMAKSGHTGRTLDVVVTETSVRINGTELRRGPRAGHTPYLSLELVKEVLGPPQESYVAGRVTVFAWTDDGIHLQQGFRGADAGKLFKFQLWLEDVSSQDHKQSGKFRGHVRVEGVDIPPGSTLESVGPALEKHGFKITRHPGVTEIAKGQIQIFTVDNTSKLERIEVWCP